MKKFITFIIALMVIGSSAFAQNSSIPPNWAAGTVTNVSTIITDVASQRAADSTRSKAISDTLLAVYTDADNAAASSAVAVADIARDTLLSHELIDSLLAANVKLESALDSIAEIWTDADNAAASSAVAVAGIDRDTTLAIAAYASILDTATNIQTNLLKAQDTLNAIHTTAVRDSVLILANTTAIGLLPSTTVTTNIAAQITAVDAIVDTSALRNWVVVTQGTATALPEGTTDTVCTVTGLVEIYYFGCEITTAQGTQYMKFKYLAGDLSISDSTADITGEQPGYILFLTGTFANPPTPLAVATEAVAGSPSAFRVRDCAIVIGQALATASDVRIKHTVCYRPLKQGSKIVMAE
jgi:hypothetical protein